MFTLNARIHVISTTDRSPACATPNINESDLSYNFITPIAVPDPANRRVSHLVDLMQQSDKKPH